MSAPVHDTATSTSIPSGFFTPVRVLGAVAVLLVAFVIFAPQENTDQGAAYSSYATGDGGVRALYDVLGKLGFAVSRNEKPLTSAPDTNSAYVLVKPAQPLTTIEQMHLLEAVRQGAILLFTADDDDLTDSLGFRLARPPRGFFTVSQTTVVGGNPRTPAIQDPRDILPTAFPISATVSSKSKSANQLFLWLDTQPDTGRARPHSTASPALMLGHRFGRGYVIAFAPAQIVVNQLLHEPRAAIAIVRALQFANTTLGRRERPARVVFDEYHHGFGAHADMPAAIQHALTETPLGRTTVEVIVAALVLLLAFGIRPLAPLSVPTISRRSPLEHVGALAHAYSQVHARSLGTSRLVRGLRRRHPLGLPRSVPDSTYLSALRDRIPAVSADINSIVTALAPNSPDSSDHFATTGAAVANIERAFRE